MYFNKKNKMMGSEEFAANKTLILLTDCYPISVGEYFLDDEIKITHAYFNKIIVITNKVTKKDYNRFIPNNMQAIEFNDSIEFLDIIKSIKYLFKRFFWQEYKIAKKQYAIPSVFYLLKVMFADIAKAVKLNKTIASTIRSNNLNNNSTILYSYWHDYKALAICLNNFNLKYKTLARAHRWDIYFYANDFPYLPFKNFILTHLHKTYSISKDGKSELEKLLLTKNKAKIEISRLGKINHNLPIFEEKNSDILICSCSTLTKPKRVHLIIDLISELEKTHNIQWIHFGDGPLRNNLEAHAKNKLKAGNYIFKGNTPNKEIIDFYCQNYIDLFVNLSDSEGIPVSIMEVQSAGIPVLATNVGGNNEIVNNENGFIIEKDINISNIASLVSNYLLSDKTIQINKRKNAYNFWMKNYNGEINYSKFTSSILSMDK